MIDVDEKFLIPSPGLLVRDPRTRTPLPAEGAVVPWIGPEGRYWRRRVTEGSCTVGSSPVAKEAEKVEKPEIKRDEENIVTKERKIRR